MRWRRAGKKSVAATVHGVRSACVRSAAQPPSPPGPTVVVVLVLVLLAAGLVGAHLQRHLRPIRTRAGREKGRREESFGVDSLEPTSSRPSYFFCSCRHPVCCWGRGHSRQCCAELAKTWLSPPTRLRPGARGGKTAHTQTPLTPTSLRTSPPTFQSPQCLSVLPLPRCWCCRCWRCPPTRRPAPTRRPTTPWTSRPVRKPGAGRARVRNELVLQEGCLVGVVGAGRCRARPTPVWAGCWSCWPPLAGTPPCTFGPRPAYSPCLPHPASYTGRSASAPLQHPCTSPKPHSPTPLNNMDWLTSRPD